MADCKRKTANLFDKDNVTGTSDNKYINQSGTIVNSNDYYISYPIAIDANSNYTWKFNEGSSGGVIKPTHSAPTVGFYDNNDNLLSVATHLSYVRYFSFTTPSNCAYVRASVYKALKNEAILNEGTTPIAYEPYGWLHSLRKLTTATDTITTLPADVYADGNNATVGLKGNMSQSGTPTPQNPIQPSETGERTGNLFDKDNYNIVYGYFISEGTTTITAESSNNIVYIPCKPNTTYTVSKILSKRFGIGYTIDKPAAGVTVYGAVINYTATSLTVTTDSSAKYLVVYIRNGNSAGETSLSDIVNSLQITEGSTARPYEPYGYKLTISSANTTTPVYLGEVQTTRKIKKLVLTGQENDYMTESSMYALQNNPSVVSNWSGCICSHFIKASSYNECNESSAAGSGKFGVSNRNNWCNIWFNKSNFATLDDFKAYLAAQYAAGTPVTVWYVLSSATTGVVNEPLRKIGEYADTVSGITIPTVTGKDTFDVETTLKPSEVELTYTGWHDASVQEKSRNLFDYKTAYASYINADGDVEGGASAILPIRNSLADIVGQTVTIRVYCKTVVSTRVFVQSKIGSALITSNNISQGNTGYMTLTITPETADDYWVISYGSAGTGNNVYSEFMLNSGSTALPYEPYWK